VVLFVTHEVVIVHQSSVLADATSFERLRRLLHLFHPIDLLRCDLGSVSRAELLRGACRVE